MERNGMEWNETWTANNNDDDDASAATAAAATDEWIALIDRWMDGIKWIKINRIFSLCGCFSKSPEWDAQSLHGQVYSVTDDGDLPLAGMNTNACEHTSCPIQPSNRQTYVYTLPLAKKFPVVSEPREQNERNDKMIAWANAANFYDIHKMFLIVMVDWNVMCECFSSFG